MKRILVPLDHSGGTAAVIEYAGALAEGIGASLTLLHVYEPPNSLVAIVPGASVEGELAIEHAAGLALIERAVAQLASLGSAHVETRLERAPSAAAAIIDRARDFDLIVMGTHGRTGMNRLVMGSVAESVVRRAPCPVLCVHLPGISSQD